ncbi:Protein of unknown function DUF1997 [Gloeocapsa sp. PCC 7428]|uniref:DUF1997 domain-containing protein n=1 Tax=Gloeocapsa sp. PCC 7428 TaxID=1173026 RepID=UPI0002A5F19A|nr:DUF1997 domain-containing protein [Gloeocapsa sp. PCC 7428]AFZ32116.1 Protein of unknown function DUF1997 [Gloeocapsa sp. PCC 7428]
MLSSNGEYKSTRNGQVHWDAPATLAESDYSHTDSPTRFHGKFTDCMEMYAPADAVANYLDAHQGWFCRCAQPMKVESVKENAYALTIGRIGSFGYEVEPKVGLELLPPDEGIYRIKTIPVPNYIAPGYDVDFHAVMELVETAATPEVVAGKITRVEWELDLAVAVHFPKFIQRLPKSLVQNTGDRLLNSIVKQVSRRLTHKVQEDFHKSLGLPIPTKSKRTS